MEFVGRIVRKEFKGFGVFTGVVNSYDPSTGFFEIVYEDGDSEELELPEIASLLEGSGMVVNDQSGAGEVTRKPTRVGRKPKKRRRIEIHGDSGKVSANLMSGEEILGQDGVTQKGFLETRGKECGVFENLKGTHSVNGNNWLNLNDGLNLTEGFNLNDGFNLNFNPEEQSRKKAYIDLNLDANGDFEENLKEGDSGVSVLGTQKREHYFDLNLGLDEEVKNSDTNNCEGLLEENTSFHVVEETQKQVIGGGVEKPQMEGDMKNGKGTCFEVSGGTQMEAIGWSVENVVGDSCLGLVENAQNESRVSGGLKGGDNSGASDAEDLIPSEVQLKGKLPDRRKRQKFLDDVHCATETVLRRSSSRVAVSVSSGIHVSSRATSLAHNVISPPGAMDAKDFLPSEVELNEVFPVGTPLGHGYQGNLGSTFEERNARKRRKILDNANSATETVLRRSSRRVTTALSDQNYVSSGAALLELNEAQPSPAVSAVLEEKPRTLGCEESEEYSVLPSKLQLPASSVNMNLDGIPVLDLFSVYACLRSFSTLLFLSPFELENFVASLKCKAPSLLLDSIHVSLLQTLRKHLEFLSDENSQSASNCLRSLNWDLLDLITWPIFMGEYLLTHGSGLKPGFDICKLKLFESDYYKQPASVKIEILQCLCDDVIEVEAITSELNRRALATELNMEAVRSMKIDTYKSIRTSMDVSGGSCLTEEVVDGTTDWNSDECCLCKMDGSLICCDGCPEAYHLRCVGVANSLLPEGDWYCPECMIDKDKPWLKLGKSLRGAELLGVDPSGRLYYSSCGYLLVADSCNGESSYHYYRRDDLTSVIEALKSSDTLYSPILGAISKQWNVFINSNGAKSDVNYHNHTVCSELMKGQIPSTLTLPLHLAPSETYVRDERNPKLNSISAQYSGNTDCMVSVLVNNNLVTLNSFVKMENSLTSFEGSAETSQAARIQNFAKTGMDGFNRSAGITNDSEIQGKILSVGDSSLTSTNLDAEQGKNVESSQCVYVSSMMEARKDETSLGLLGTSYVNCYSFARTASLVAEELTRKSSDKITVASTKSVEDLISTQLKAISKKATRFAWPNAQNLNADARKEKCGWCFSCKAPDDDRDCFFNLNDSAPNFKSEVIGDTKWNKKSHLIDVMCYILCIEDRLRGFLLGPWLNPLYTKLWRKSVVKASDVSSLKHSLLVLESNLRRLALSADWLKHVDSAATMGSASHVVTSSLRVSSKHGNGRKRARYSDLEPNRSSKAVAGLCLFWWRGGRLSRELFNWKVLPRSLASKAARQAGCSKISGILYPDSSGFANRSKYVVWQAAVEASRSVEQLALQVRELDANIRWDDIENTNLLLKMDQFRKSVRPFKKVIIRRKCTEGTLVKYLLDFGKRRIIPDLVVTHGSMAEETSSGRKKYWLEESHVPLHLLKAFEERRIARKSNKMSSGKLHGTGRATKKPSKKRGFSYLFAKAERSENYQCGHCNKYVLISEAVRCQYCKGFFHKRHVRKSSGAISANCTYTCHKCRDGNCVKVEAKKGKFQSQKTKKGPTVCRVLRSNMSKKASNDKKPAQQQKKQKDAVVLPLRRSARRAKFVSLQNKKLRGGKKGKQRKSRKGISRKPKEGTWQKKRTRVYHTYWLNGLLLSRKPNDDRVMNFRSKNLFAPRELLASILGQPKCSLCCEQEFSSTLNYVGCEICGDWFHGDAFGLCVENIGNLIGYRCHKCRSRTPPVCPHLHRKTRDEDKLGELNDKTGIECTEGFSNITELPTEVLEENKFHTDEESKYPSLDNNSSHEDQELMTVPKLNQLNAENEHLPTSEEQKTDAIQIPNEKWTPDLSMESNELVSLVENKTDMDTGDIGAVTTSVGTEFPLSQSDATVIDTEMASLGHNCTEEDFVKTAILGSIEHKTRVDSSESPPRAIVASGEIVDGKVKIV